VKNLVVAAKLKQGKWKGASVVDAEFIDSFAEDSLVVLVSEAITGALATPFAEGTEVSVNITFKTAE
jgi:hypothetical protein